MHDSGLCESLDFFQEVAEDQSSTALQPGRCLEVVVAGKYRSCDLNDFVCIHAVLDPMFG